MPNLAEAHRPRALADILGQPWIVHQLQAFAADPVPCAFLFEGATGTGKTSCAYALADALGCAVAEEEFGGFWQIASGEQDAAAVRQAQASLRQCPAFGSGWRVLVVNEADAMTKPASMIWLDALENLPPRSVIVFTTNDVAKIPARLRDRCERFAFEAQASALRPAAQELVDKVWQAETGQAQGPELASLGPVADEDGNLSFRRVLQRLQPHVRTKKRPVSKGDSPVTLADKPIALAAEPPAPPLPVYVPRRPMPKSLASTRFGG